MASLRLVNEKWKACLSSHRMLSVRSTLGSRKRWVDPVNLAVFHDESNVEGRRNILGRIARHRDDVG
ncbi:Uncharacterised protein [Mycobacterium tuberculosis]|nr:Uncharacterised protein [Mycobacterium tuberculosis]